jgi:tetratricopeptide (TPR) repeat protein
MPYMVNGIGTWHYGKQRIYRRKSVCPFCNRIGERQSYDTTLYFVFLGIPLVPLSRKRVLEQCPFCTRHQAVSLKKWEQTKAADVERLLEKLSENPDDRDTILAALTLSQAYQDQTLFDKLAPALAEHRVDDAEIQAQLGRTYAFFSRWQEAERAYRAALVVKPDSELQAQLALMLLKQMRPDEAAPLLTSIVDTKNPESAWLVYLLIEAYQAQGRHVEALQWIDRRDAAYPELAGGKAYRRQRKLAEKYRDSNKPIAATVLTESEKTGYHEGGWTWRIPRLIGPALALALLTWYLGAAVYIGQARRVFLVNGWTKPYMVTIDGRTQKLESGAALPIRLAEGDVEVSSADNSIPIEPVHCHIETPFFSRPFSHRTFVINPDRLAALRYYEAEYAANPVPQPAVKLPQLFIGNAFYSFTDIDYEFEPLPQQIKVPEHGSVKKTQVSLLMNLSNEDRLALAERCNESPPVEFGKQLARLEPEDSTVLAWLLQRLHGQEAIGFLQTGLGGRPILVEWHRAFQSLLERQDPERDLRPQYRQLAKETHDDPDALYLLARVENEDPTKARQILERAVTADRPSAYAMNSLGYHALCEAKFNEAVTWTEKAVKAAPANRLFLASRRYALLAAHRFDRLNEVLQTDSQDPRERMALLAERVYMYGLQKDKPKAMAVAEEAVALGGPQAKALVQSAMEISLACAFRDVPGYLQAVSNFGKASIAGLRVELQGFEPAFLQGDWDRAAKAADATAELAPTNHALLYLAAVKKGDKKKAESQWQALAESLRKAGGEMRRLALVLKGKSDPDVETIRRLPIDPGQKRVLLAVIAERYPALKKDLEPLSRALDYTPDATSLCLAQVRS